MDWAWLDTLFNATLEEYKTELADNVFESHAILEILKKNSKVPTMTVGTKLIIPVLFGKAKGLVNYGYYDKIQIKTAGGLQQAEVPMSRFAIPMAIATQELEENSGKAKIIDLLQMKLMQAEQTLEEGLASQLWGTDIIRTENGVPLLSIQKMIEPGATDGDPAYNTEFMGIDPSAAGMSPWKAQFVKGSDTRKGLRDLVNKCKDGSKGLDVIVTNEDGYNAYEDLLLATTTDVGIRYTDNKKGDASYADLSIKNINIILDKNCPSVQANKPDYYGLNSKSIGFKISGIRKKPFNEPDDQDARSTILFVQAQLFTNERRRHGVFKTIAAAD